MICPKKEQKLVSLDHKVVRHGDVTSLGCEIKKSLKHVTIMPGAGTTLAGVTLQDTIYPS